MASRRRRPGRQEWRPVPDYEGLYEVSSKGLVWSLYRHIVLKPSLGTNGRLHVGLYKDGKRTTVYVHQIVAGAFHGKCPPGQEVRHWDGNRLHNAADNLVYGTRGQNALDSVRHGTHNEARKKKCPEGHPLDGKKGNGKRYCKTCNRKRRHTYYQANREKDLAEQRERYQRKHPVTASR
jgi:HNH endonuclease/NUMOD4 motif